MDGRELQRVMQYNDTLAWIYNDDRFPKRAWFGDLRSLTVTMMWVLIIERPANPWPRIQQILHLDDRDVELLIASDAPRYEEPLTDRDTTCQRRMVRRPGLCGNDTARDRVRVIDPDTGRWRDVYFCNRHDNDARQLEQQERERWRHVRPPEPMPNTGGLMPCYFTWNWPDRYAACKTGWKPPSVGVCADEWPVMEKVVQASTRSRPALVVIQGNGDTDGTTEGPGSAADLQLLRSGR